MKIKVAILGVCFTAFTAFGNSRTVMGDVLVAVQGDGSTSATVFQGPNQVVDFFIRSDASETVASISVVFDLPQYDMVTGYTTGLDNATYFGNGILEAPIGSPITVYPFSEEIFDVPGFDINQEFSESAPGVFQQPLPASFTPWFSIVLDTSALEIGSHDLIVADALILSDNGAGFDFLNVATPSLQLNVSAVPEPGSLGALAISSVGLVGFIRRRKRNSII
ncbi:hypothetical protein CA13_35040 [Planctomycetes bacterium CA13]|uniref:Ice-binding protein C-terminal domain-containing protein n=1 Tax=Novipirellula herctigrandis TaxID=2527986 RepID=A0A5C5Z3T3_9BACT|nr:hypothetical protein CA13_35040 [Planctomycetes bacterium CA13]